MSLTAYLESDLCCFYEHSFEYAIGLLGGPLRAIACSLIMNTKLNVNIS